MLSEGVDLDRGDERCNDGAPEKNSEKCMSRLGMSSSFDTPVPSMAHRSKTVP